MISTEQFLLLKNTLNLELSMALQKLNILYARGNVYNVFGDKVSTDDALLEINELKKKLKILNECYKKILSFEETVEKLELLPQ